MGDIGARLLAKALQINNKLRSISLDRNNVTLQGKCPLPHTTLFIFQFSIFSLHFEWD